MVCNDIPRDIPERDPPRTYVCTYVRTYVLCENRSPIQSLALMRSAIIMYASKYAIIAQGPLGSRYSGPMGG